MRLWGCCEVGKSDARKTPPNGGVLKIFVHFSTTIGQVTIPF